MIQYIIIYSFKRSLDLHTAQKKILRIPRSPSVVPVDPLIARTVVLLPVD